MKPDDALWPILRSWLEGDEEGRALLARFQADPQGTAADLARCLQDRLAQAPPPLAAYILGGQVEKLIQIAQAEMVQIQLTLPPTPPSALHQLPPDIADFTGRREQLKEVTALLTRAAKGRAPAVAISAVAGMPGVGKSALAIHAAHCLKAHFPDAQLYINLRGTEGQPLDPSEALAAFLRALGVDDHFIPKDLDGRVNLYRSLLESGRALVLLDNAHDEAQVRPLLPGSPTCAVLITSRRRLTALEGAVLLDLEVMTGDEALKLLERLAGRERIQAEPEAARRIADLCGRLPLALRIAGGTLRGKRHWTLAGYAGELADERGRLERLRLGDLEVRASFALSYRDLAPADARLFRRLGLLAGPDFAPEIAAALLDAAPEAAREGVERLVDAQLLEPAGGGRYRFHDLVRLFARERLEEEEPVAEQQAARLRAARWLNEEAEKWDAMLRPDEARRARARAAAEATGRKVEEIEQAITQEALTAFERERENLRAAVEWAHAAQEWGLVVRLAGNLAKFYGIRSLWADWAETHELALKAARQSGDRHGKALTLMNLGNVYLQQGRWEEAIGMYEQAQATFRALGDRHGEGQTLANMGLLYEQQGQKQKAVALWREALTKLHPASPEYRKVAGWLE